MSKQFRSHRTDGRGHWPLGKPRHGPVKVKGHKNLSVFMAAARRWIVRTRSLRRVSRELGISAATLSRWLDREAQPNQQKLNALQALYRRENP